MLCRESHRRFCNHRTLYSSNLAYVGDICKDLSFWLSLFFNISAIDQIVSLPQIHVIKLQPPIWLCLEIDPVKKWQKLNEVIMIRLWNDIIRVLLKSDTRDLLPAPTPPQPSGLRDVQIICFRQAELIAKNYIFYT